MRRLFIPSVVLLAVLVPLQVASFWHVGVGDSSGAARLWLSQGCLRFANLRPGHPGAVGVRVGGWSADALEWAPRATLHEKVWAVLPGAGSVATQLSGPFVQIPLCYPLAVAIAGVGLSFHPYRRDRRARLGLCRRCGYDVRGVRGSAGENARCPECGDWIARLARLARAFAALAERRRKPGCSTV